VTTVVQRIDAQGPVVVERISTQFSDVTCSPENARKLVEALHSGTSVTLTAEGKTATFTPTVTLGYGEAYIALALAAEALRGAGITGCATPEQWQAVLMGGPLAATGTTSISSTTRSATASATSSFPGIIALRSQGQGWGQIAQTTNVQLGQVVSGARTAFKIDATSDSTLSPTGLSSGEMNRMDRSRSSTSSTDTIRTTQPGDAQKTDREKDKGSKDAIPENTPENSIKTVPPSSSSPTPPSSSPRQNNQTP
jgi:hypothetical protein